jgi:hypothetical protein
MSINIENYEACLNFNDNRLKAVFKDRGSGLSKFNAINKSSKMIKGLRVDDCLITDGLKCDYLLIIEAEEKLYFIELKGSDLVKAVDQINTSLDKLLPSIDHKIVSGRIVLSKVNTPDLRHSRLLKLRQRLKQLNGTLEYKSILMEEII